MIKADFHIHTIFSHDCNSKLEDIVSHCINIGVNCVAITDHGTIRGAVNLSKIAPFKVIIGEEILTEEGEIIGLFLTEEVPSHLPLKKTINLIKSQNGMICVPHPMDYLRKSSIGKNTLMKILEEVDIIEIFNSRSLWPWNNLITKKIALSNNKLCSVGSDAHTLQEIGNATLILNDFNSKEEFVNSLRNSIVEVSYSNPLLHIISTKNRFKKNFEKRFN